MSPTTYWSGQTIHQVMAEAAQQVDPNFRLEPVHRLCVYHVC